MKSNLQVSQNEAFIDKLTQIIFKNIENDKFGVSELSKEIGLNRSYLHRKLNILKGQSVSIFIREIRLQEAIKLLQNTKLTASEVAYKVGFNNPSYFNTCFREHFGFPPGEAKLKKLDAVINKNIDYKVPETHKKGFKNTGFKTILLPLFIIIALIAGYTLNKTGIGYNEKSIAILPFENLSTNEENQHFADGLVEDLLNRLSKLDGLKVISRTSSEVFRNKGNKTVQEIARILDVNHILVGSLQCVNNKVKINVQLIDAKKDNHIMSTQYERKLDEVFKVQSEIAEQIAKELSLILSNQQYKSIQKNPTSNPRAMEYYQMGRFHSNTRQGEDLFKSIDYFNKAISIDSNYALAYAGLADSYQALTYQEIVKKEEGKSKAIQLANKAIDIDPNMAESHAVLGVIYTYFIMDWQKAEEELQEAISLNPNYSTAYQYYSEFLSIYGRDQEARKNINIALKLDPFSFIIRYLSAVYYYNNEEYKKAFEEVQMCLELGEHPWALNLLYYIYLELGNDDAAFEVWKQQSVKLGYMTEVEYDSIYKIGGNTQLVKCYLIDDGNCFMHEPIQNPSKRFPLFYTRDGYPKSRYYALIKEKDKTLSNLEIQLDSNILDPFELTFGQYKFVRSDKRFLAIREKIGLPPLPF